MIRIWDKFNGNKNYTISLIIKLYDKKKYVIKMKKKIIIIQLKVSKVTS